MHPLWKHAKRSTAVSSFALVLCCGCQKKPETKHDLPSLRVPAAAELFDLETKCNALGQKALDNDVIGSALTHSQISHYNPADNRCYVLLDVSTADLRTPLQEFISDQYLIDGQTGEILASRSCKGHECTALVFDESLKGMLKDPTLASEAEVRDLMDKFVHTDRHLGQAGTP